MWKNYIDGSQRCWNRAIKLAIIQQPNSSYSYHQWVWICDACFKIRFSNGDKFKDQLLQVTNLAKNKNDDIIDRGLNIDYWLNSQTRFTTNHK